MLRLPSVRGTSREGERNHAVLGAPALGGTETALAATDFDLATMMNGEHPLTLLHRP